MLIPVRLIVTNEIILTVGTTTLDSAIIKPNKNTKILYLLYLFIIDPTKLKNKYVPVLVHRLIQSAYLKLRLPKSQYVQMFEKVLNRIMYILVAAVTVGGTPIPISIGLNTMPPPSPKELDSPPPTEAKTSRIS